MNSEDIFADMRISMNSKDIEDIFKERINNKYTANQLDAIKNIILSISKINLKDKEHYNKQLRVEF